MTDNATILMVTAMVVLCLAALIASEPVCVSPLAAHQQPYL